MRFYHFDCQSFHRLLLVAIFCVIGCSTPDSYPSLKRLVSPPLKITPIVDNLSFAVKMAVLPDGRILLTEKQSGKVRLLSTAYDVQSQPVVDFAVNSASERGLLGITSHPKFNQNGYVYVLYVASETAEDSDNREDGGPIRLVRFRLIGQTVSSQLETLLTLPARPGPYHNGGCIRFGPDGKLYVSLGELNRNINVVSLLKHSPRGKILRYNDDGTIPSDNPFGSHNPVYIYGVRNSFGFAFDLPGKEIFVSDNGPNGHDRLSKAKPGENLGWPLIWGTVDRWYEGPIAWWFGKSYRRPLWESFQEHVVPTGVQVLPDDHFGPGMAGRVLMSAYGKGQILQFSLDSARRVATGLGTWAKDMPGLVDIQLAPDGNLYALSTVRLYRIEPADNPKLQ